MKRVFLIVLDSFGVGELPDAAGYGDEGSNTLKAVSSSRELHVPNLTKLGLYNIDGCENCGKKSDTPVGCYCRLAEKSKGKDTTIGHWEIAGLVSHTPLPTYPNGFPSEIISEFERRTGRRTLCNKPYSGTDVIRDYGEEHIRTGALIVYTSADSVFQIAAHEDIVPVPELYQYCTIAREIMQGKHGVGRIIARPFVGSSPSDFARTSNRHDFSLAAPSDTMLDLLKKNGLDTIAVGKINDIFAGRGITEFVRTTCNADGMAATSAIAERDWHGLCFVNLVDFDMLYGHRNDVDGYAKALSEFDVWLSGFLDAMREDDVLFITSDHGCDPSSSSTDHSREYTLLLGVGKDKIRSVNLGTRRSFADISATILDIFGIQNALYGESFWGKIHV